MLSGVFFFRPKAYSPAYIESLTEFYRGYRLTMKRVQKQGDSNKNCKTT